MRGIILVNLGTPASNEKEDVRNFIAEMLSDPLLTDKSRWLSKLLATRIIAPQAAARSSAKYKLIWRNEEPFISPIIYNMTKLAEAIESKKGVPVSIAMRYGMPDIRSAFKELSQKCPLLHEVIIFPLYPHFAQSTTQTTIKEIGEVFYRHHHSFRLKITEPYFNHPEYINALAESAQPYINDIDKLIFVYHSLPNRQQETAWKKGKEFDYVYQIKETNRLICDKLNIKPNDALLFFSSQRDENWLKPFLDQSIGKLPELGWKKVAIMSPGFPSDNMETLFDIDIEARKLFMDAGGEKFSFIPSLNYNEEWVDAIWNIIEKM